MKILLAVDWPSISQSQISLLRKYFAGGDLTVKLVHVLEPIPWEIPTCYPGFTSFSDAVIKQREASAFDLLKLSARRLYTFLSRQQIECEVREGDPAEEIERSARQSQADLIIVGRGERDGWSRLLAGSVSQDVLSRTQCSVLVAGPR